VPSGRGSHQPNTSAERQDYWETRVKLDKRPTPTVDERAPEIDSTETPLPSEPETTRRYQPIRRPRRRFHWLREHWIKVLGATVGAGVVSLGGWALHELYSLNREIGEIRAQVDGATKQQEQLRMDFQRFEEQMQREIDRMNDRLDRVPRTR